MRWKKIIGNTGLTFFTVLGSFLTFDTITNADIPMEMLVLGSVAPAVIQGGMMFFREILSEDEVVQKEMKRAQRTKLVAIMPFGYSWKIGLVRIWKDKYCFRTKVFALLDAVECDVLYRG